MRTDSRFGLAHVVDVLRGSQSQKVLGKGHDKLSVYGIGGDESYGFWKQLAEHLITSGRLGQTSDQYRTLRLTHESMLVLKGELPVKMPVSRAASPTSAKPTNSDRGPGGASGASGASGGKPMDSELFQSLRELRTRLAQEGAVPPYVVFGDAPLRQMARDQPTDEQAFLAISGVGQTKLQRYGPAFLEVIRNHTASNEPAADEDQAIEPVRELRFVPEE